MTAGTPLPYVGVKPSREVAVEDESRRRKLQDSDTLQGGDDRSVSPLEPEKPRRAFRVLAWILSLWLLALSLFGLMELVLMWLSDEALSSMFGDEIPAIVSHRTHFMIIGILAWSRVLSAFVQLRKPARREAPMLLLVAIAVGGAIVYALSGTVEEWVVEELTILIPVLALAWLHPGRARFGDNPGFDRPMVILAGVGALPWLVYAFENARLQFLNVAGDPHAQMEHWATAALMAVVIIAAGFLGSSRHQGWRLTAWIAAAGSALFGLHSLVFPGSASGLTAFWAWAAIAWGVVFAAATVRRSSTEKQSPLLERSA